MYGTIRNIFFVIWVMLHPQDKNVIGTKIENCSIPPFKQGETNLYSLVPCMQYTVEVQKGTKQNLFFQATYCKNLPKNAKKKLVKSPKFKKNFLYPFLCVPVSTKLICFFFFPFFCKLFFISVLFHPFS